MGIDGARGAVESYCAAVLVEHDGLADVLLLAVERHDVARSRQPERQGGRGGRGEVRQVKHLLMRQGVRSTVTRIVHDEGSALHLLRDKSGDIGKAEARSR